mmetsp:Transcript_7932/g.33787  ORF Transcript_7932/g.33787 Transcript_7932/m.33787 type:complete len:310 (+) Transcript_7932:2033-2962(+)
MRSASANADPGAPSPALSNRLKICTSSAACTAPDTTTFPPMTKLGMEWMPISWSMSCASPISSKPSSDSRNRMASSRSTPAAAAASHSISASFSFLPSTKCLWLRSLYTASATSHPRFLVIHWISRWLLRVELARRSRLNFSIPTSCPRSFSLCRCFCAANAALPPHLRSKRTRLVSQKLSSVSYAGSRKNGTRSTEKRTGFVGSIGSDITSFIAFWRWRFPMNPLGHMVSLMSSTVTSWWCAAADAGELDQRLRGAGKAAGGGVVVAFVTRIDETGREARERCRAGSCVAAVARARSAPTAVEARRIV